MDIFYHTPVLVETVTRYLSVNPDGIYVDGTLGGGGHAESILTNISPKGKLIGFDMDIDAITFSKTRLGKFKDRILFIHGNFSNIKQHLNNLGVNRIDGLLLDLGLSSHQIDDARRGFSFREGNRIDMRMDREQQIDGWKVINTYDQNRLADVFWKFGEERNSRRIAKCIIERRDKKQIESTEELAEIISSSTGKQYLNKTLARIFQAIRIEVNNELENLRKALNDSVELLRTGGRIAVISYHSLEDRIAKDFFKEESRSVISSGNKYIPDLQRNALLEVLSKKPIIPSEEEIVVNPRARSAKLRVAERL